MFPELLARPVRAEFDEPCVTSDGGALLLKAADERLELTDLLAVCLGDRRDPARVKHELVDLVRQRVFGLALGYADANDAGRLAGDPMQRMLLGRDPVEGRELASQPTLSRFENGTTRAGLYRMGLAMAHAVLDRAKERRGRKRTRVVTIDVDPMDDPTHGQQQLTFFNGHYDCWCYLPLMAFVSFDDEAEQWLVASVLRPGNAPPARGAEGLLRRLIALVRERFPKATVRVRLDGGFASGGMLDFLEGEEVEYVVGLPRNARLEKATKGLMREARRRDGRRGHPLPLFTAISYRARRWKRPRRVVAKAEIVHAEGKDPKENPRYIVTNLPWRAREVYAFYCQRGDVENRLKELKALGIDRTSCSGFWANQLRVLLAAAAYAILQELRDAARHTSLARAQLDTLRLALLRIGARVVSSARRLVVHMTGHHPWRVPWLRVAAALGAV